MDFVAIDFETIGYEDGGNNDPWQLGIAIVQSSKVVDTKEWFFGTARTPDFETMYDQWDDWAPYLLNRPLVAHNIATEKTILTRVAPLTKWGPWTDTLKLAKKRYPTLGSYALGDLCNLFGLAPEISNKTWHDGLYDAVACANLAIELMI